MKRNQLIGRKVQQTNSLYDDYLKKSKQIKSIDIDPLPKKVHKKEYDEGMAAREAAALEIAEKSKTRTAPAYSKGPYQYISELDIPYLGRKL